MAGGKPAEQRKEVRDGAEPVPLSDPEFKDQLAQVIPHLRAFGRSLSGSRDLADDLVQETLLKAWAARASRANGTISRPRKSSPPLRARTGTSSLATCSARSCICRSRSARRSS